MSDWIKCGKQMPVLEIGDNDMSVEVLVNLVDDFDGQRKVAQGSYSSDDEEWYTPDGDLFEFCKITHWMPLPEPPK